MALTSAAKCGLSGFWLPVEPGAQGRSDESAPGSSQAEKEKSPTTKRGGRAHRTVERAVMSCSVDRSEQSRIDFGTSAIR